MNSQLETVVFEMEKAVRGKRGVIEHILAALLAEGHILLDDMPGVGKTTLAVALIPRRRSALPPRTVHAGRDAVGYRRLLGV